MDMQQLLAKLKKDYLNEFPQKIKVAREQYSNSNWPELQDTFHKLKGSGKTYGIPEISEVCQLLESLTEKTPNKLSEVFQDALSLLLEIGQKHLNNEELSLNDDERFKRIQKQLA